MTTTAGTARVGSRNASRPHDASQSVFRYTRFIQLFFFLSFKPQIQDSSDVIHLELTIKSLVLVAHESKAMSQTVANPARYLHRCVLVCFGATSCVLVTIDLLIADSEELDVFLQVSLMCAASNLFGAVQTNPKFSFIPLENSLIPLGCISAQGMPSDLAYLDTGLAHGMK
jgi:hypothetical protein